MARQPRIAIPGLPHHITHRGNRSAIHFSTDGDFLVYRDILFKVTQRYQVNLYAYCLMPTHIHLVAVPPEEHALSNMMRDTEGAYARYFNKRLNQRGHAWEERFYCCMLDEPHM